jgi:hypothetical protein
MMSMPPGLAPGSVSIVDGPQWGEAVVDLITISHTRVRCAFGMRYDRVVHRTKGHLRIPFATRRPVTWVARLDCRGMGPIHSTDRVRVERGGPAQRWCGFHASWI